MPKTTKRDLTLNLDLVREWLRNTDGYSILAPEFFRELGFDEVTIDTLEGNHRSDARFGKNAAHRADGQPGDVKGIAEFSAIYALARMLEVDLSKLPQYYGRGRTFRSQVGAILSALPKP